ncbi:MAG: DUF4349 domain-containing protein [Bacteroidota bacterium]
MHIKHLLSIGLLTTFMGCSSGDHKMESQEAMADTASVLSSSAATNNPQDTTHQFIRTADLKFKVKDVQKATTYIEDITAKYKGFVTYTNLTSNVDYKNEVTVSADSILETTHYTVENELTLRVPNTTLDSTLREISSLVQYLDYRIIKADEVGLERLSNTLAQKRLKKHEERLTKAIDQKGKKLTESANAEDKLLAKQEWQDQAQINNLQLQDQINFSTVKIQLYQRKVIASELIKKSPTIEEYQPGFFAKIRESAKDGWYILEELLLFFTKLWGIILLIVAVFFAYRKYATRWQSKA